MDILNLSALVANPEITQAVARARRTLQSVLPEGSFTCREQVAMMLTNEVVRSLLEEELQSLADEFGERVAVQGVVYQKHEPGTGKYHSLCGTLNVTRCTYRQVGVRNGPTVVPVELVAGIAERATPAMAYSVAHGYAQQDSRAYHESLQIAHRVPPSRATLERMASALAEAAVEQTGGIQGQLRRVEKVPEEACAVVMGLDRTSVPMAEPRPADAPAKPAPVRRKPLVRRPPEPFDVNWRMAYVGTVSIVDRHGEALTTRRYAAPASDDPAVLVEQMAEDIRAAVRRDATLHVGIVQDGAPEMWNLARAGVELLREDGDIAHWVEGIDRYHLMERLAKALDIIGLDARRRQCQLDKWKRGFDEDDSTIDDIQSYLTAQYAKLPASKKEQLWEHLAYVQNNNDRMRYGTLRTRGLPVGSGVTESAAKTVIGQRTKNSGQRWCEPGLRGVLTLRALHQSRRLPAFWTRFSRRYTADVRDAA
jgi:hypothetical protein